MSRFNWFMFTSSSLIITLLHSSSFFLCSLRFKPRWFAKVCLGSYIAFRTLLLVRLESKTIMWYRLWVFVSDRTKCVWWVCQALRLSCCFKWLKYNFYPYSLVLKALYIRVFLHGNTNLFCFFFLMFIIREMNYIVHINMCFCRDYLGAIFLLLLGYYFLRLVWFCSSTFWQYSPTN